MRGQKGGKTFSEKCAIIEVTDAERKFILRLRSLGDGVHLLSVIRERGDYTAVSVLSDGRKLEKLTTTTK